MIVRDVSMAIQTMRASRARSVLTMLGVIIAVAAVTSVVSIGNGIKTSLARQANQYSENVISVRPAQLSGSEGPLSSVTSASAVAALTQKDADAIYDLTYVESSVPLSIVGTSAKADGEFKGVVFAANSDLPTVLSPDLDVGSFYTPKDSSSNVAVLGANAADALFDQNVPLGRSFSVRGQQFIVSGVLSEFPTTPFSNDANFNNAIFVSDSAKQALAPGGAPVYEILVKIADKQYLSEAERDITNTLAKIHGSKEDFEVLTPEKMATESTATFDLITDLTLAAAIITLLVSGVGIMNVMLVSVTERTHEIGIRKALGATNRQILGQFVTEAATLCVAGSIIGAIIAFLGVLLLGLFTNLTPQYDWQIAGISCVAACLFGVFFGTLPAFKAARKDPITALRSE